MNILFIGSSESTFVQRDFELLSKHYEVHNLEPPKSKEEWPEYIRKVKELMSKCVISLGWFAGWHTLPMVHYANKYRKPSMVVVGGYDAVSFPEIRYGAFSNLKERIPAKYVLKNVDLILPVSHYLMKEIIKNAKISLEKIILIHLGVDPHFWRPNGEKDNMVLTVATARDMRRIKIKGLDTFVKAAKYVPEAKFVLIGIEGDARKYLESIAAQNVEIKGYIPNRELLPYYQRAKVYAQLSISEAFGVTLAEAMLSGCIPVGTKRGGIPEVIGDTGFYVPYGNAEATAKVIREALQAPKELGLKARKRIANLYPIERRENELVRGISIAQMFKYSRYIIKRISCRKYGDIDIKKDSQGGLEITISV